MKRTYILCLLLSATLMFGGCSAGQTAQNDFDKSGQSSPDVSSEADGSGSAPAAPGALTAEGGSNNASGIISADEAESIALSHAGYAKEQVTVVQNKLDYEDGRQVYEIEFYTEDYREYDYEIDALTKDILSFDQDAEHDAPPASSAETASVSAEDAKNLALSRVPGAAASDIREFETDFDHGRTEYEGKIFYNGVEYEFEINGSDGSFLSWEEEYAD